MRPLTRCSQEGTLHDRVCRPHANYPSYKLRSDRTHSLFGGRIKAYGWLFPGLIWLRFWTTCPHPEFPTPTSGGGNVWPNDEYTPPGTPPSVPLTPDEMASVFCNYSIPAPKCMCQKFFGSFRFLSYRSKIYMHQFFEEIPIFQLQLFQQLCAWRMLKGNVKIYHVVQKEITVG